MINSNNEWDKLKRVVVGDASHANWPSQDRVFALESKKTSWSHTPVPRGPVEQWIIDETNQDLDTLVKTLESLGIDVVRPQAIDFRQRQGMYNYCPRDRLLVLGNKVVDVAMMYPCRDMEIEAYEPILHGQEVITMPRDQNLILDAANVCRLGSQLLFLESPSGNRAAYQWLCKTFPQYQIEICNFYSGVHIDSTVVPLRPGLVALNAHRVGLSNAPRVFDGWHKIWINDIVEQPFHQYPWASKWIGMNMLVIDQNTVICDASQKKLINTLESYRFDVIPLTLRHSRTLGGGFHCVTLDLVREP